MKNLLKGILFFCAFMSLGSIQEVQAQTEGQYFKNNVAVLNMRIRSLNSGYYVREIVLHDFVKQSPLNSNFGFKTDGFFDNGQGNDQVAGDGVYTSRERYAHTASVPYDAAKPVRSVITGPVIDQTFRYENGLDTLIGDTGTTYSKGGPTGHIKLVLKQCPCPQECRCLACDWGWTNWCLNLEEVEIEIGW